MDGPDLPGVRQAVRVKLYMCGGERPESGVPIGLGYLKANCRRATIEYVADRANLGHCDLIGLSAPAAGIGEAVGILQSTTIPVVVGGQCTLWPGLREYPFRWIVKGDGEQLLQRIIDGTLSPGFHESPNDASLDDLEFPDRGSLNCGKVPIVTSRGCPFHCFFCSSSEYWGRTRFCSPEYFISEVEHVLHYYRDARWLYIMDDLFVADKARFARIHDLWMSRGLNRYLALHSFVRAGVFDQAMGRMMKEMGFRSVRFGAESGSDRVLALLGKGNTVERNQRVIDDAAAVGLPVTASFMHHVPGETEEERAATLAFIDRNKGKLQVEGYYRFAAFPGTRFYSGEDPTETDMRVR